MREKHKAIGQQGAWFATVNGRRMPCIHDVWLKKLHYCDPGIRPGEKKWEELFEAIRLEREVILAKSSAGSSGALVRVGYIATWTVSPPQITESGLEFDLLERRLELI